MREEVSTLPTAVSRRDRRLLTKFGITSQLQVKLIKLNFKQIKEESALKTDHKAPGRNQHLNLGVAKISKRKKYPKIQTKPFLCNFCTYTCDAFWILNLHVRKHTGEKPYKCTECTYASINPSNLRRHVDLHHKKIKPEKTHFCQLCSKGFTDKLKLDSHILRHTGERPYACQFCKNGFTIKSKKSLHEDICKKNPLTKDEIYINNLKRFKCDQCSYAARDNNSVKLHRRSHSEEKPFHCSFCNYRSSFLNNLQRHERAHTGVKPYACSKCPYRATNRSCLKKHVNYCNSKKTVTVVTTHRPFVCKKPNCKATFTTTGGLRQHHRTQHLAFRPFQCPDPKCSVSFLHANKLAFHLSTHTKNK